MHDTSALSTPLPHAGFSRNKAYRGKHALPANARTASPHATSATAATSSPHAAESTGYADASKPSEHADATQLPSAKRTPRSRTARHAIFTTIGIALCLICIPILTVNITLLVKHATSDDVPGFAGEIPLVVVTDSMSPVIEGGDLIICDACEAEDVSTDDIICFHDPDSEGDALVIHRVCATTNQNGNVAWRTQGDANNIADSSLVTADELVGKYNGLRVPGLGNVIMAMQTPTGVLLCIGIPLAAFALWDGLRAQRKRSHDAAAERARARSEECAFGMAPRKTPHCESRGTDLRRAS